MNVLNNQNTGRNAGMRAETLSPHKEGNNMYTDLMIDFETLDTRPTAAVTQLGWCLFNAKDHDISFRSGGGNIIPDTDGRSVSWSTISWWMTQSDEARSRMIEQGKGLSEALDDFALNITHHPGVEVERVWANGPSFDLVIYENCAAQASRQVPWKFWQHRCMRTLYEIAGYSKEDRHKPEIPHVAEYDAIAQSMDVVAIYKKLGIA